MRKFGDAVGRRFKIGKTGIDDPIDFNGCCIRQNEEGSVTMVVNEYLNTTKPIPLEKLRRKQIREKATESEFNAYRRLAGESI